MAGSIPSEELDKYAEAATVCASSNFRKASRAVTQLFDQALEPSGLRSTQLVILLEIAVARSSTVPQIARRLVMDRSTLTRNLKPLVKRGFIKVDSSKERRSQLLTLTPRGRKAVEDAVPLWNRAQTRFVQQLGQKRWRNLRENLSAAVNATRGDFPLHQA